MRCGIWRFIEGPRGPFRIGKEGVENVRDGLQEIVMPQLAESLVSATIERWLKQPGDTVEMYEPICEINTDKVNAELPSTVSGKLVKILAGEGETVYRRRADLPLETAAAGRARQTAPDRPREAALPRCAAAERRRRGSARRPYARPLFAGGAAPRRRARRQSGRSAGNRPRRAHHPQGRAEPHRIRQRVRPADAARCRPIRPGSRSGPAACICPKSRRCPPSKSRRRRRASSEYFIDVTPLRHTIATPDAAERHGDSACLDDDRGGRDESRRAAQQAEGRVHEARRHQPDLSCVLR